MPTKRKREDDPNSHVSATYGDGKLWHRTHSVIRPGIYGPTHIAFLKKPRFRLSHNLPVSMAVKSAANPADVALLKKELSIFETLSGSSFICKCFGEEISYNNKGVAMHNLLLQHSYCNLGLLIRDGDKDRLSEAEVRRITRQVLEGVSVMHSFGYVHCGLCPEIVLIFYEKDGFVAKIGDFGNHRGLGGVSVTSDCFYNAGWTEDAREVINYLHREYTKAPLYAIGTSIGANILVKYLGEDRDNVPIAGAVAICSPWDLLIGDRFISRRLVQRLYDRALCIGLQGYAQLHQPQYSRLANWEGIEKSRSIRDFDNYATCLVGKFETVDTYYRRCSSTSFVDKVSVPLLCISALDDPLCTREAIPWDECRANKNIVLATTKHGGHLAFFEGVSASGLWWVRASLEFLSILHGSPYKHRQNKMHNSEPHSSQVTTIDQGPYISVSEGMVAAMSNEPHDVVENTSEQLTSQDRVNNELDLDSDYSEVNVNSPIQRCFSQLSRQNKTLILLLSYIAVVSTWPLVGAGFRFLLKKKLKGIVPTKLQK